MILLDTNVLSELMRSRPDRTLVNWLDKQPAPSIWTTSITLMEIRFGLLRMPPGRRRESMTQEFEAILHKDIEGRIAPFEAAAAEQCAILMQARARAGRAVEIRDTMIAGIVLSRNAKLATRNTTDFADLGAKVINPWRE